MGLPLSATVSPRPGPLCVTGHQEILVHELSVKGRILLSRLWLPACLFVLLEVNYDECDVGPPEWFSRLNTYVCVPTLMRGSVFWFKNYCAIVLHAAFWQLQLEAYPLLHRKTLFTCSLSQPALDYLSPRFVSLQTALSGCSSPFTKCRKVPRKVSQLWL